MDSTEIVLWLSSTISVGLGAALMWRFRAQVKAKARILSEQKAKARYSWFCIAIGVFCAPMVLALTRSLFNLSFGHGEILIAAPIFNLFLSLLLIIAGRILMGWTPIKSVVYGPTIKP